MPENNRMIDLPGSESNSGKARLFREGFPGMLTPDFAGSFEERVAQLRSILFDKNDWTLIGSSYGGLMERIFTLDHEAQVRKLILLAPALMLDPLASHLSRDLFLFQRSSSMGQPMTWYRSNPYAKLPKDYFQSHLLCRGGWTSPAKSCP